PNLGAVFVKRIHSRKVFKKRLKSRRLTANRPIRPDRRSKRRKPGRAIISRSSSRNRWITRWPNASSAWPVSRDRLWKEKFYWRIRSGAGRLLPIAFGAEGAIKLLSRPRWRIWRETTSLTLPPLEAAGFLLHPRSPAVAGLTP